MKICFVTLHDKDYQPLADLSWNQNKKLYCEKHGHDYVVGHSETKQYLGFRKIFLIEHLMSDPNYDKYEWFFWTGCDVLITNFNLNLEDLIDDNYHFLISKDCHNINADVFLVKNSKQGRDYIKFIASKFEECKDRRNAAGDKWEEQQVMIDHLDQFKDIIKFIPQKKFNAIPWGIYNIPKIPMDVYGNSGEWEKGDFIFHYPGANLQQRLEVFPRYLEEVIK